MARSDLLQRVRRLCLSLPDTEESSRLGGEPHFYVRGKIFAGCGEEDGRSSFGVKVGLELQSLLVARDGIHVAKYVGKHGWITVEERALQDDAELERLIRISYELIAAKAKRTKRARAAAPGQRRAAADPAEKRAKSEARGKGTRRAAEPAGRKAKVTARARRPR